MIAQKFIDCGYPMTCRVLTFFGEPILTYYRKSTKPLSLPAEKDQFEQHEYMPALPDRITFNTRESDILKLAADAYRAMPDVALQACDIVREKESGRLYLLEVNPGGGTWMFSSKAASGYRQALGVSDLTLEFDAFRTIARVLAERTRAEAE
jgi:glutathione synthase/RimK-type ligase-like ATP-grasp enzyme